VSQKIKPEEATMQEFKVITKVSDYPNKWQMKTWSMQQVLHEINRDHSAEWTNYDATDWREGWSEWVDPEYTIMVSPNIPHRN
jgi:hypothetical protein